MLPKFISLFLFCCVFFYISRVVALSQQVIVDPEVFSWAKSHNGVVNIMMELKQIDYDKLYQDAKGMDEIPRGRFVYKTLMDHAESTQSSTRQLLREQGLSYDNLWIQNTLVVEGVNLKQIELLSSPSFNAEGLVRRIWLNGLVDPGLEEPTDPIFEWKNHQNDSVVEWNVRYINADKLWDLGITGDDIVLGISDTGTRFTHEALKYSYRGLRSSGTVDHNYNWFDPSGNSSVPVDTHGHGTHVMATASGGFNSSRKVGVAPSSKWISCRPFGRTSSPANFIKCLQFFLAPTNLQGNSHNPDLRPHITSHSYVCNNCNMLNAIKALRASGSLFVKSCGNSGPRCSSITEPGFYAEVICAGALTKSDQLASFSSRGPSSINSTLFKPDFTCPGQDIISAYPTSDTAYRSMSGTSMAAPCLNGAIGLLWSALPRLRRQIDETISLLQMASRETPINNTCNSENSPNNLFGYGKLDILKAYEIGKAKYGDIKKNK